MTTWASDDLAQVIVNHDREFVGFAQGVLKQWNPDTFENVVSVRGGDLPNLPVAAGVEALTYQAGDVLMLTRWKLRSGRGSASYWIGNGGRVIFPGPGRNEQAIAFLRGELAKQISAEVIAERVHSSPLLITDPPSEVTTSTTFTDLATAGPTVSNIDVSPAGKMLVIPQAGIAAAANGGAAMSFEVTGATSQPASDERILAIEQGASQVGITTATVITVTGLNPGIHQVTAKYRSTFGDDAFFSHRGLTVIAY